MVRDLRPRLLEDQPMGVGHLFQAHRWSRGGAVMERIAIIGSREGVDFIAVRAYVRDLPGRCVIVTGGHPYKSGCGARPTVGVDEAAYLAALEYGHVPSLVIANWDRHG